MYGKCKCINLYNVYAFYDHAITGAVIKPGFMTEIRHIADPDPTRKKNRNRIRPTRKTGTESDQQEKQDPDQTHKKNWIRFRPERKTKP